MVEEVDLQKSRWQIAWAQREDDTELLSLFSSIFGHEMPLEQWRWKYPNDSSYGTIVKKDGRLIAFYGGIARPIRYLGKEATAVQFGDVMVDVKARGNMTRKGPFFLSCTEFLEKKVGHGKEYLVAFGFPTLRAMRVGELLKLYAEVDRINEVLWRPQKERSPFWLRLTDLETMDPTKAQQRVDQLWSMMAQDLRESIVGVRDWTYVKKRYIDHPSKSYRIILVRNIFTRKSLGLFIVNTTGRDLRLLDVIAPLRNIPDVIPHARSLAAALGLDNLLAWITRSHLSTFMVHGAVNRETDTILPANIWSPGPSVDELRDRWWLTAGDTDFF